MAAECDVQTLLTDGACFACLPPGIQAALRLQLLCELITTITSAPTNLQEVFPFTGDGATAPTFVPPQNRGVAYDLTAPFPTWKWNPNTQTWT